MIRFCIRCRCRQYPESDCWGVPLPGCGCAEPAIVDLGFNPATRKLIVARRTPRSEATQQLAMEAAA